LEAEKAAEIMEEMSPNEAADALAELEDETSEDIMEEMDAEPVHDVRELLEFPEDSAGGLMNTEYLALLDTTTVAEAMSALRQNEELLETLNTIFLVDQDERLTGAVPLAKLFIAAGVTPLKDLEVERLIHVSVDEKHDRVTEAFDKYNLLTLAVTNEDGKLAGTITADEIISLLRQR
jgi:magnesium transporter